MTLFKNRLTLVIVVFVLISTLIITIPAFEQDKNSNQKNTQQKQQTELEKSIIGTALNLDGELGFVEINDSDVLNTINKQLTVSVWIKTYSYPDRYSSILYKGDLRTPEISNRSYVLFLRDDGAVQFASSPKGMSEDYVFSQLGSIKPNTWHHIVGVIDSNNGRIKIYIDGELSNSGFFLGEEGLYESILPLRIGNSHEEERLTNSPFHGQIDEVSVWNIALTQKQIKAYRKKPPNGKENGLVGYWNFDKSSDGRVSDLTPHKNDGMLIGNAKLVDYILPITEFKSAEQIEKATDIIKKIISAGVDNLGPYQSLAEIYIRENRHSDAEKVYLSALDAELTQDEHDTVINALLKQYNHRNANDEFIKLLEDLKPRMEGSAILHELLGDAYKNAGEEEKAELTYRQWLRILIKNGDQVNIFDEYTNLTEKLLNKNLFPEDALNFALDATESSSTSNYIMTLGYALLVNELYDEAYQLIEANINAMQIPYMERRWFLRIVKAGRYVNDKVGYIKVLERLVEAMSPESPNYFNSIFALAQFYKENNLSKKADELIQKTGFVSEDAWMVLAPFENIDRTGYTTEFIEEDLLEIDTKAKYDGKYGKIRWKKYEDEILNGYIGLGNNENWGTGYAYAVVTSPEDRHVDFRFDSDDQGKVWLNGNPIFEHTKAFTAEIDFFEFHASLKKGKNIILVKVCEETGGWGFYLRITDKDGKPYDDLKINAAAE